MFYFIVSINLILYVATVILLVDEKWGLGIGVGSIALLMSLMIVIYYSRRRNRDKVPDCNALECEICSCGDSCDCSH
ncbi:hypothetical protein [Hazenella coriacea]|uniref:Uncharacterized protein n=1 Tax=Hazenella coriacea TaxID=1179467 RepID=A0A4R3L974_9BACL|nr:hypothetical protein [Hazenella coriacea]TCS95768.1 hypothetical protein EDD58_102348 [Hazenella coriacea]